MKHLLIEFMLLFTSSIVMADGLQHVIDIKDDKIVINTDSLDLPQSTSVYEVLTLLPDLLDRTKEYIVENYDIQINEKTVGNARDAVLMQIHIADLKYIEICENTLSNVSSMGESGSINLELRSATKEWSGSLNGGVSNLADYSGGMRLEHKSGKWIFHGVATTENYVPMNFHSDTFVDNEFTQSESFDKTNRAFSEFVACFLEYRPNKHNLIEVTGSETYSNNSTIQMNCDAKDGTTAEQYSCKKNVNALMALNFEHLFDSGSKICTEVNYRYIPENYDGHDWADEMMIKNAYSHKAHNIFGKLKLELPLMHKTSTRSAQMEIATQYNIVLAKDEKVCDLPDLTFDADENTYCLNPYGKIEAEVNKWQFMAYLEYQHFSYDTKLENDKVGNINHCDNITGQAVVMYVPNKRNMLRLRYIRSIKRPDAEQLYPYTFYDPTKSNFIQGNSDLTPMRQNAVDFDYSVDLSTSDYHLELKASVEYSHSFDNISSYQNEVSEIINYVNRGKDDVVLGDLGAYYHKKAFSCWFSGNVYHKMDDPEETGKSDHYTYFNLILRPAVELPHKWMISVYTVYNGAIKTSYSRESEIFYAGLRISKKWKQFNAYIYGVQNILGKSNTETETTLDGITSSSLQKYENMHSHFGGGIRFNF